MTKAKGEADLAHLTEWLAALYGDGLVSLVLYGSLAGANHHGAYSDINVLCVLEEVTAETLARGAAALRWWQRRGHRPVSVLSRREATEGAKVFPIEFFDLRQHRRVLAGADVFATTPHCAAEYRWQVEHDLRARLIGLRGRYVAAAQDRKALQRLLLESAGTFLTLLRHAVAAAGGPWLGDKAEAARAAAERFAITPQPFLQILAARRGEGKLPGDLAGLRQIFAAYLQAIQQVERRLEEL
ncbi:MAG: hypothetical protein ACRD2H_16595 [Terriglobales bacterium]